MTPRITWPKQVIRGREAEGRDEWEGGGEGGSRAKPGNQLVNIYIYIYIIQILCVCVCLSSIGGQTAGPIMTKFGTHMRIDLRMVPT